MTRKPDKPLSKWREWKAQPDAIEQLCSRIVDGEMLTTIAHSLGTGVSKLSEWISSDPERSARAREARIAAAATYADQALQAIKNAADPFELAKAKEEAHHLRWRASKSDPGRFGEKLGVEHSGGMTFEAIERKIIDPT